MTFDGTFKIAVLKERGASYELVLRNFTVYFVYIILKLIVRYS